MLARPLVAAVVTATAAVVATSALAAPTATTVTSVSRSGAVVTASGTALFDGVSEAVSVGGTNTAFAQPALSGAAGLDLVDATIAPLAEGKGLRFTWKLASMPAQVPPEVARYTWSFSVGGKDYQLQAKRTNMGSQTAAEDPAGHAQALSRNGFFQLRGNCGPLGGQVENVTSCPSLAFLSGAFDPAKGTVSMDVPFGLAALPELKPGVVVTEAQTASMSIAASFSAGISNTATSDYTNGWNPYYVGGNVGLATGPASAKPTSLQYRPATLTGDQWSGTVDKVAANHTTLFVRSCEAATCTFTSVPLG